MEIPKTDELLETIGIFMLYSDALKSLGVDSMEDDYAIIIGRELGIIKSNFNVDALQATRNPIEFINSSLKHINEHLNSYVEKYKDITSLDLLTLKQYYKEHKDIVDNKYVSVYFRNG